MNQRIIYPTDDGGIAIIIPSPEYLAEHTIEELAAKDVPEGKPFKIVDRLEFSRANFSPDILKGWQR